MKSVGEVMAIGRTFQESLQKALRGLETGVDGFNLKTVDPETIGDELAYPRAERLWYVADAFGIGMTLEESLRAHEDRPVVPRADQGDRRPRAGARAAHAARRSRATDLRELKRMGFSDRRLAHLLKATEGDVRARRHALGMRPVYKRVDTCAAEFATRTAYMYSTYEDECEAAPTDRKKVIVLGGGPNRIGQGIEFDYCCVHAALALREDGFETIMVNCNPETVSTDYDTSDRLYFEPLTLEDVLEIVHVEKPWGVIVQFGGQTPLKLARDLEAQRRADHRHDAGHDRHGGGPRALPADAAPARRCKQPPNRTARTEEAAIAAADEIGYPLVVRPSYVLGGRAMEIVHEQRELERYMREAVKVSNDSPVLLDRFLNDAIEVDVDAICDGNEVRHRRHHGAHRAGGRAFGRLGVLAAAVLAVAPSCSRRCASRRSRWRKGLNVVGLMNVQFAIQFDDAGRGIVYVLEVNPRASRTVPFVSKATGRPLAKIAARCMVGQTLAAQGIAGEIVPPYFSVKEAVFPFIKFPGVDTILGPEMKSTGEVMGVGETFGEAFVKSQLAAGVKLPAIGPRVHQRARTATSRARSRSRGCWSELGFKLVATRGTAAALAAAGVTVTPVNKVAEGRPHIVDMIKNDEIALVVNTVEEKRSAIQDSYPIRRAALQRPGADLHDDRRRARGGDRHAGACAR